MRISNDMIVVGKISTTHGLKGTVKVLPMTDNKERFYDLKQVMAEFANGKQKILSIKEINPFKEGFLIDFNEIKDLGEAQMLRGALIQIPRSQAIELEEDEYFIFEIIGAKVITDQGEELGELVEVLETGANDVYEVKTLAGKEILIPVIPDCVLDVDPENKVITVHLLEGMRE